MYSKVPYDRKALAEFGKKIAGPSNSVSSGDSKSEAATLTGHLASNKVSLRYFAFSCLSSPTPVFNCSILSLNPITDSPK